MSNRTRLVLAVGLLAVGACKDRTPSQPAATPSAATPAVARPAPTPTPTPSQPTAAAPAQPTAAAPTAPSLPPGAQRVSPAAGALAAAGVFNDPAAPTAPAAPSARVPNVSIGAVSGEGELDAAAVGNALASARGSFEQCYASALQQRADLAGAVVLTVTLGADGTPTETVAEGVDPAVASCISGRARQLGFPAGADGTRFSATLTLASTPAP